MNKIVTLTPEELTRIASKEGDAILKYVDKSNVKNFIGDYRVNDGDTKVPNYLVYYHYCKLWKPQGKKLTKIGFLRKFSVVFTPYRTNSTRYFMLNSEAFGISRDEVDEAKRFDERYRKKKGKKNKQEIAGEIPSSPT